MNTNSNIEELVSRYLEGEMSDIEKLNFENQLVNNPGVQEEFQLQKDILEGIREHRKAELKARLNDINIPSAGITQYLGLKVASLITVTAAVGFGVYFALVDKELPNKLAITGNALEKVEIPEIPEVHKKQNVSPEPKAVTEAESLAKTTPATKPKQGLEKKSTPNVLPGAIKENKKAPVPAPEIVKPDFVEDVAEETIDHKGDSFELNVNSLANVNKLDENRVEVETVFDRRKDFHYKFYNKKLYLYGDFEKAPYEIIEYNADVPGQKADNKLYFLYYEGKFYELETGQMKVSPLKEIVNEELINELKLLRK